MLDIIKMSLLATRILDSKHINICEICNTSELVQAGCDRFKKKKKSAVLLGYLGNWRQVLTGGDGEVSVGDC